MDKLRHEYTQTSCNIKEIALDNSLILKAQNIYKSFKSGE